MDAKELQSLIASTAPTIKGEDGWFTTASLADNLGQSRKSAQTMIRLAASMGLIVAERRHVLNILGEKQSIPHYRLRTPPGAPNGKATRKDKAAGR